MRTPIERLAYELAISNITADLTIHELADIYDESNARIQDALDVIKIRNRTSTTLPPVPWPDNDYTTLGTPSCTSPRHDPHRMAYAADDNGIGYWYCAIAGKPNL